MNTNTVSEAETLSKVDQEEVFRLATKGFVHFHRNRFEDGMSDIELEEALSSSFGIFGGSASPDRLSVSYKDAGLKIWCGWHCVNHVMESPLFEGSITLQKARETYGITNPDDRQMMLF